MAQEPPVWGRARRAGGTAMGGGWDSIKIKIEQLQAKKAPAAFRQKEQSTAQSPSGAAAATASSGRNREPLLAVELRRCLRQKQPRRSRGSRPNCKRAASRAVYLGNGNPEQRSNFHKGRRPPPAEKIG